MARSITFLKKFFTHNNSSSGWPQHQLKQLLCHDHYYHLLASRRRTPTTHYSLRSFAYGASKTNSNNKDSPYDVLQVKANASKEEIKLAFRTLAKLHHPDLNRHLFFEDNKDGIIDDDNNNTMARLVNAYETLMEKYSASYLSNATDSRVALACEIYTIDELRNSQVFDVYTFRISYSGQYDDDDRIPTHENENYHLDPFPVLPINAHPQDSTSDLKRSIQSIYAAAWGLEDRKRDRDGLYLGWELVCRNNNSDASSNNTERHSVLSYHLFLESYGINDGDLLYSVVRK